MSDSGKIPYRTKWTFARFRISGHTEKQLTKQQQKRSRNSKVTHSCDQWTKIEVGNMIGLFGQIGDAMILSLPKKIYIIHRKTSSVHEDGIISFWQRVQFIRDKNANCQLGTVQTNRFCVVLLS